jgi:hypothetical protein
MAGMTGAFVSRRRADEFDALLSAPARERDSAAAYADLLEVVGTLRATPVVTARADFVTDLRSQLIVEAARMARPVDDALRVRLTPRQRHGARERRAATLLGGFAIVAATGSMAMASQSALPGDVLYPVKRAIENAETNLQSDDAAKARTLIAHAENRLDEAQQLTAEGADATTVASTLQDFTEQSNQAAELALDDYQATGDQDAIGDLRSFADESMDDLTDLGDVVPSEARPALITAAQSVLQNDSAAFNVCPTCGEGGITELPPFAAEPVSLASSLNGLLSLESTPLTVKDFDIDQVEEIAQEQVDPPKDNGPKGTDDPNEGEGNGDTTVDPPTVPEVDPEDVTGPLQNLGQHIKDGLTGGGSKPPTVSNAVDEVVNGIGQLVDGILGK